MTLTLVTGGTGFLGTSLVRILAERGERVRVFARDAEATCKKIPEGVEVVQGDMLDADSLVEALRGASRVFHSAALVAMWERDARQFHRVNVEGLTQILRLAAKSGVERMLYVSSFFALGPTDGGVGNEEARYPDSYRPATPYEQSKYVADQIARRAAKDGFPLVTIYPGVLYGAGEARASNLLGGILLRHLQKRLPGIAGKGDRRWCCAYVDDVVEGALAAMALGKNGGRYILGGENRTLTEVFALVEKWTGVPPPRRLPYFLAEAAGLCYLARARWTGTPPEITPAAVEVFRHDWAYTSRRAEEEIRYRVTPFERGLLKTLRWLRSRHRLAMTLPEEPA